MCDKSVQKVLVDRLLYNLDFFVLSPPRLQIDNKKLLWSESLYNEKKTTIAKLIIQDKVKKVRMGGV